MLSFFYHRERGRYGEIRAAGCRRQFTRNNLVVFRVATLRAYRETFPTSLDTIFRYRRKLHRLLTDV